MKKSSLPWRYALSGLVAMTMMAPAPAFAAASPSGAQQAESSTAKRTVTGTVVDAVDGEPLPGATVAVVGDKSAITATDIDGNFSLSIPAKKNVTLLVTYVGYKEMRVPIGDLGFVKVELKGDDNTLDEVVVVGSGTQKRVSVTGAITSVKGDDLKLPSTNLTNALAGKIAGVIAQTTSGEPGSAAEFYIRGIGTFGGRATPLILLDDVEISANDLNYVPAENIESFSILKDASATAIYGSRGANGVMIVKTKGGDYNSQTKIGVSFDASFNFLDKFPDFVDGARYMEMYNIARVSRGNDLRYTNDEIRWTRNGVNPYLYPDVNWGDILFRNMASRQRGNVNVSGGGSKVKYYMAIDVQHEDGLLNSEKLYSWNNNIQLYNYTFQNNISYKLTSSTTISMNMNAQVRQKSGPNAGAKDIFNYTLTTTPISFPVTWPAQEGDEHIRYASRRYSEHVLQNPYAVLNTSYSQTNETTLNTVVKLNQGLDFITKGLRFEAWVNLKSWSSMSFNRSITPYYYELAGRASNYITNGELNPYKEGDIYRTNQIQTGTVYLNESALGRSTDQTFELQARFDWNRKFGLHDVGAMVSYRQYEFRDAVLPNRNQGFSFRATYDYAHRYLVEFNAGYNGTERLAKGERFGFFPAGSLGWVISNEPWFSPASNVITNLKVRASLGIVGSDDLSKPGGSYFLYIDKISGNNPSALQWRSGDFNQSFLQLGGPIVTYYAVTGLGWEKSRKADVGVEFTLFGDLTVNADLFWEHRYDIFLQRQAWPASLGYDQATPWSSKGTMENHGGELALSYNKRINNDWSFGLTGTFTYAENKVSDWDEPIYPYTWMMGTGIPNASSRTLGYIAEGLFRSDDEIANSPTQNIGSKPQVGDIKYRDLNGDGVIDNSDQTMISEYGRVPRIQYGFGATLNWRQFDFGVQFTGSAKRTIMMSGMHPFQEGGTNADARNILGWISDSFYDPINDPDNFDVEYPRLGTVQTDVSNNSVNSTWWMRDGSLLRMRNIELGWRFPYGRVYVSGQNLVTFAPFKHWDPELDGWNSYPMQKTVSIGVQVTI
ncbi:MAG: TonB-dependent receptor [Muribaculaceae bacterium]|nr:TonB-dependent receptor [Muribaculaceae bacterium]